MEWKAGDIVELMTSCERHVIEFINDRWVFCLSECKSPERTYLAPMDLFLRDVRRPAPKVGEVWERRDGGTLHPVEAVGPNCVAIRFYGNLRALEMENFLSRFRRVP